MAQSRIIGIIAGNGVYPETFIHAARREDPDARLVVAAFHDETKPEIAGICDSIEWFRVGQVGKTIRYFVRERCTEAVMIGQIAPKNLFNLRPDLRALVALAKLKERNAESLFGAIADELEKDGIRVISAVTFLDDLLPPVGHVCGPPLRKRQVADAEYGFRIAKETSRLDIGQSVLVRHGTVLAVEGFEGTNACIRRGGELGRGRDVTLVKVSKPNQDFRFDVPVIGPQTVETCAEAGVSSIAIEAGRTLVLEKPVVEELCMKHKVSIHAVE